MAMSAALSIGSVSDAPRTDPVALTCDFRATGSSPRGLVTPPYTSVTAMIVAPRSCMSLAAASPTLPKPCTATRAPSRRDPSRSSARPTVSVMPRPVASAPWNGAATLTAGHSAQLFVLSSDASS